MSDSALESLRQECKSRCTDLTAIFNKLEPVVNPDIMEELRELNAWLDDLSDRKYSTLVEIKEAHEKDVAALQDEIADLEEKASSLQEQLNSRQ